MYRLKTRAVLASEIAAYLNKELSGDDFSVEGPDALRTPRMLGRRGLPAISGKPLLLITDKPPTAATRQVAGYLISQAPEVDLAYVLREFFSIAPIHQIHPGARVDPEARIGRNVMIGAGSVIGPDVEIGDSSVIQQNVVLSGRVRLGKHCFVKDGAVIGSEGYGFVIDEAGFPIHPPHLGQVVLGDRVWIGANSTIERALLEDTLLCDDVKVDDLCHIGAGSVIGTRSMLTAGVVVAYGVSVGQDVRLAPNVSVREQLSIADRVTVGQGAVVIHDIEHSGVYVGNPARLLESRGPGQA